MESEATTEEPQPNNRAVCSDFVLCILFSPNFLKSTYKHLSITISPRLKAIHSKFTQSYETTLTQDYFVKHPTFRNINCFWVFKHNRGLISTWPLTPKTPWTPQQQHVGGPVSEQNTYGPFPNGSSGIEKPRTCHEKLHILHITYSIISYIVVLINRPTVWDVVLVSLILYKTKYKTEKYDWVRERDGNWHIFKNKMAYSSLP